MARLMPMGAGLARRLRRFGRGEGGVALVEFAFVLPVMVAMYLGGIATTQGVMAARKATALNHTLGDLMAQVSNVASGDAADDFAAATGMMAPLAANATILRMRVSRVYVNTLLKTCVDWSVAPAGTTFARTVGANIDTVVPLAVRVAGTTLIVPEVEYDYKPIVGKEIVGNLTFKRVLFLRPRLGKPVTLDGAAPPSSCPRI